jgi:hypothetical protein
MRSAPEGKPYIKLVLPKHRVVSLNGLLSMNPWARRAQKKRDQAAVLSALRAAAAALSTHEPTCTAEPSTLRMHASTLESYMMTKRLSPKAMSSRKKSEKAKKKAQ